MPDLSELVQQGGAAPGLMAMLALVLGALHALEPGHSKTMMAAFIIAVRGTAGQAVILGLAAAFSHSLIVWVLALAGLTWGDALIGERLEPWFLIVSGAIILGVAAWILAGTLRQRRARHAPHHDHGHHHHHHHDHDALDDDAHARAHAAQIEARFADGRATTLQVLGFGLTGGLLPCAAAVTVLLLCLQLERFWLGVGLVAAFSAGLAITLVAVGLVAAMGMSAARKRTSKLDALFDRAPYLSAGLIAVIGVVMLASGWSHLASHG